MYGLSGILTVVDEDREDEHTFVIVESTDALIDDRDCFQIIVEKSETGKTTTYLKGWIAVKNYILTVEQIFTRW